MNKLPNGLIAIVKRDCPTCTLVEPVLQQLTANEMSLTVYTQDDPAFPADIPNVIDDTSLEVSYRLSIETVPTLIRVEQGQEVERIVGWNRTEWATFTGTKGLGKDLPDFRPGCGSKSVEPGIAEELEIRFGGRKQRLAANSVSGR